MPVNIEIKGNLARLLATENLIVEHKQVETAMFDVDRRVLTLPQWKKASNTVYDMLVAHEVGHALFTPFREWNLEEEYRNIPPDFVNVVEDARIERLMKKKFAGLSRDFYNGYQELSEEDFFCVGNEDINKLKLIDKINLYFKVGAFLCFDFNDDEQQFITEISQAETFDDVLDITNRIHKYCKQKKSEVKDNQQQFAPQNTSQTQQDPNAEETEEDDNQTGTDKEEITQEQQQPQTQTDANSPQDEFVSDTQKSFDSNSSELIDRSSVDTTYITLPKVNYDLAVVDFKTIKKCCDEWYAEERTLSDRRAAAIDAVSEEYRAFKKSSAKEVNYLVKEFECKKSADAYARATTSRTGVLNTSKLHTYKYNEDLFKKVTNLPDGKNHGLTFYLDWSGSMQHILLDTVKQLYQLVWFCKKVNIPFEVYAFTNDSWSLNQSPSKGNYLGLLDRHQLHSNWTEGELHIEGNFRMVEMLTSSANSKDLDKQMLNIWLTAQAFTKSLYRYPSQFQLSGTPLNEAIVMSKYIIERFIAKHKLQKAHAIVLTDGEGYPPSYNATSRYYEDDHNRGTRRLGYDSYIRHNGRNYHIPNEYAGFTKALIRCVKDSLPGVSFIGFRVLERGSIRSFYYDYGMNGQFKDIDECKEIVKKKQSICIKDPAFDLFFGLPQTSLSQDSELTVEDDASKRQVSAAFRKMFKNKKSNKFVLSTFVDQIA
tara:strand:- start:1849 stop:3978 length:2130 start_codon:yes stop_codon:yes gene_type:complete